MPDQSESRPPHVDDETFERYACGELNAVDRARVEAHAAECPDCARVLRGLTMLAREAARFDTSVARPARSWPSWGIPAAIAAALAIVVLAPMMWTTLRNRSNASVAREASPDVIQAIAPRGRVAAGSITFAWHGWDGATRYEVRLFEADGALVWFGSTDDTSIPLPPEIKLAPRRYYWQIRAVRGAVAESALVPITIVGSP